MIMESSAIFKFKKPIVLVGMMGVGKTTYGKKMASILKIPFIDVDQEIEADIGHSVAWIFENAGEAEFRKMEQQKIADILKRDDVFVLALGGGAFLNKNSRDLIKKNGVSVWLKTPAELILKRVSSRKDRPLLNDGTDRLQKIKTIMSDRESFYKQSDLEVETDTGSQKELAMKIIKAVEDHLQK